MRNSPGTQSSSLYFQVVAVHVDAGIFDSYYNGCCNGTFWPLFHSMPDRATFIADHWRAYSAVNEEFAAKTVRFYARDDRVFPF